jgi:hypothetical protein
MTKPRKAAVARAAMAGLLFGLYPAPRSASTRTRSGVSRKIGRPSAKGSSDLLMDISFQPRVHELQSSTKANTFRQTAPGAGCGIARLAADRCMT